MVLMFIFMMIIIVVVSCLIIIIITLYTYLCNNDSKDSILMIDMIDPDTGK